MTRPSRHFLRSSLTVCGAAIVAMSVHCGSTSDEPAPPGADTLADASPDGSSSSSRDGSAGHEAGADARADAGGSDTGTDGGTEDGAWDSGPVPSLDASPDASQLDASSDTSVDAAVEATSDSGPVSPSSRRRLAVGTAHVCYVTNTGNVACWGSNSTGQGGTGAPGPDLRAATIAPGISNALEISTDGLPAEGHTLVVAGGGIVGFGANDLGYLGDGTRVSRSSPTPALTQGTIVAVRTSASHSCAIASNRTIQCWGYNSTGKVGSPTEFAVVTTPMPVSLPADVSQLELLGNATCALLSDGRVFCWGDNSDDLLGTSSVSSTVTPLHVASLPNRARSIFGGSRHMCANLENGSTVCWGDNVLNQLGAAAPDKSASPVAIGGLTGTFASGCGGNGHTCVLSQSGVVQCWGWNYRGQLGDGTMDDSLTPVTVVGLGGKAEELACGSEFTCARLTSGRVTCWGANYHGQLGDGTYVHRSTPVEVKGL